MGQTTVDYASRKDMIAAMLDLRKQGIKADVIGNGRTLRFDDDTLSDATDAPQTVADGQGVPGVPASPAGAADGPSDAPETGDGGQAAGAGPLDDGEALEDLIGDVPTPISEDIVKAVTEGTIDSVKDDIEAGLYTAEQAVQVEKDGAQRKGILALVPDED